MENVTLHYNKEGGMGSSIINGVNCFAVGLHVSC